MSRFSPVPPATPSDRYLANIMERIEDVKQKLAEEGVAEQDIPMYMPGVVAMNFGIPLPHSTEKGPILPKGLMDKEVYKNKCLQLVKDCADADKNIVEVVQELELTKSKKPVILNDHMYNNTLTQIKNKLQVALFQAGNFYAKKTKFYLDYTPCDAEAFYAKITRLLGQYENLAEQLKDVRGNLV